MDAPQDNGNLAGVGNSIPIPTQPVQDSQLSMDRFLQGIKSMLDRKLAVMKQELIVHFTKEGEGMNISGI